MKVLIGWVGHETNTFSKKRTDFDLFTAQGSWRENEIIEAFKDNPSYTAGMIDCANKYNVDVIPTFAVENAGPLLTDECLNHSCDILCDYAKSHLGQYQGICLGLHGAGCSESIDDIESYTLKKIREIVGYDMPITITLDLHANLSKSICNYTNGLFGIKENPHIDFYTTGYEAMDALIRAIKGEITIQSNVVQLPMLFPITPTDDYKELNTYLSNYKKEHDLLDLAFFPGFPYSDIKDCGASVFVTGNASQMYHAQVVANHIWEMRHELIDTNCICAKDTINMALEYLDNNTGRICLINEASDNPGAGAPGDGTELIKELFDANIKDSAFSYIYDPQVVHIAINAGVGNYITIDLGGKIEDSKFHGEPLHLENVYVFSISDGNAISTTPLMSGVPAIFGKTVGLQYKNVKFVVASVQNQTYDDRAFFIGGIDISQLKLIVLKSSQHFKAFYKNHVDKIIPFNGSGISTKNLYLLDYKNLDKPMYPIDKNVEFDAFNTVHA